MKAGYLSDLDANVASIQQAVQAVDTSLGTDPSNHKGDLQGFIDALNEAVATFTSTAKTIRNATAAVLQRTH